jgi:acetyltransferase-like isoleucine patch superfamily enzyme
LAALVKYEWITCLCGPLPGAVGLALRKWFYPCLLKHSGKGVIWGRNVVFRHPGKLSVGDLTAIDDGCLLDAKGAGSQGINIGREVIISRNCVIQGKTGFVRIGSRTDIGCNTVITSASGIEIGKSVLIAANCYVGGGRYVAERIDVPFMDQGVFSRGPIFIGDGSWLGANATVLDGVRIGAGCIVGAGAVVTKDLPENVVAGGIPAKVLYQRKNPENL